MGNGSGDPRKLPGREIGTVVNLRSIKDNLCHSASSPPVPAQPDSHARRCQEPHGEFSSAGRETDHGSTEGLRSARRSPGVRSHCVKVCLLRAVACHLCCCKLQQSRAHVGCTGLLHQRIWPTSTNFCRAESTSMERCE